MQQARDKPHPPGEEDENEEPCYAEAYRLSFPHYFFDHQAQVANLLPTPVLRFCGPSVCLLLQNLIQ